jgi:hypothetical protein
MMEVLESGNLRLRIGKKTVTIGVQRNVEDDGDAMVVDLDSIESWDDGDPVTMKELQRILALLERECDAKGMDIEFE